MYGKVDEDERRGCGLTWRDCMEVGLRENCLSEKLFKQMHGAEAEAAETSPKSR